MIRTAWVLTIKMWFYTSHVFMVKPFLEANLPKAQFFVFEIARLRPGLTVWEHRWTDNTDAYLSPPVFATINLFRLSFRRVHSRFWLSRSTENGLQSAPKDWICIISLFRGIQTRKHHLTDHRMQLDLSRNPALVSCQTSSLLSSMEETTCGEYLARPRSLDSFNLRK